MAFKHYFPVLVVLVVAAVILGFFLVVGENVERKIQDASLEYARATLTSKGEVERRDFSIGTIDILSRTDDEAVVAIEIKPHGSLLFVELVRERHWTVKQNLTDSFSAFLQTPGLREQVIERLGRKLGERYRVGVEITIKEGAKVTTQLALENRDVLATVEMPYRIPNGGGTFDYGRYIEGFTFKTGAWVSNGQGRILEYPPRKKQ